MKNLLSALLCSIVLLVMNQTVVAQPLLTYNGKTITKKQQWRDKRVQILDSMLAVMGILPASQGIPGVMILDSLPEKHYTRYTIRLTVAPQEDVAAFLYIPSGSKKKHPAMLALHETDIIGKKSVDGQGKNKNLAYGKELAERGYVVIAPDYPSLGEAQDYDFARDRYESGTMKGVFNHMRCIDLLSSMKEVDPKRIGVIGHSLGGHNAIFVAAFDPRIKVTVVSSGWTLFDFYNIGERAIQIYGGRLGPWAQERYMPMIRTKYNLGQKPMPFDFDQAIAAIAPNAFFSNSPVNDSNFDVKGVKKGIENAQEVYRFLGVADKIQVRFPESGHDFPQQTRMEAYQFIDQQLER